jgi:hypothetical protein
MWSTTTRSEHVNLVDSLASDFNVNDWFTTWRGALRHRAGSESTSAHYLPLRETVLEALSDSSAEQFLNPLTARHLRRYGSSLPWVRQHKLWFWVRSEWFDVDLSYGLAKPFGRTPRFKDPWNAAWMRGDTGDLGQIEVKVCYTHEYVLDAKIARLSEQLHERRDRDQRDRGNGDLRPQNYHGIVWLFEHQGCLELTNVAKQLAATAAHHKLEVCVGFSPDTADLLGPLWPSLDGEPYSCGLDVALFKLSSAT